MKRILSIMLCCVFLVGCNSERSLNRATSLRQALLDGNGCSFEADITADYGDVLYTFRMKCNFDANGNLSFAVLEPDSITGISGKISDTGGYLTFDENVLGFALLADGQFSPVSAPWILVKTLCGGYIRSVSQTKQGTCLCIDDSYEDDALQVEIWLDDTNSPISAEIVWENRRILSMEIVNFTFL